MSPGSSRACTPRVFNSLIYHQVHVAGHSEAPGPQVWPRLGAARHTQHLGRVRGTRRPRRFLLPTSGHQEVSEMDTLTVMMV